MDQRTQAFLDANVSRGYASRSRSEGVSCKTEVESAWRVVTAAVTFLVMASSSSLRVASLERRLSVELKDKIDLRRCSQISGSIFLRRSHKVGILTAIKDMPASSTLKK